MKRHTDFLIIGSGIAGLRAAVDLAAAGDVTLLTKADPTESNTGYAQGGIAAAVGPDDHPDLHFADTMAAGDGLCDDRAVRVLVDEGPRYVRELVEWGAQFDRDARGELALAREAAHAFAASCTPATRPGASSGARSGSRRARPAGLTSSITPWSSELLIEDGACVGVRFMADAGDSSMVGDVRARAVLLATGGAGQVFSDTTNPAIATGDGVCLAWQAGARVADMEFVQFHPTALDVPGSAPRVLLSEALRGEGARLINAAGESFTSRYDPAGDLAPRDRVARAIVHERRRPDSRSICRCAHLDAASMHARFPTVSAACRAVGLDLARDLIPVGPAAHYIMGGVETDLWGRTTVPGLFAAGEVACTGVHGANRLASNSLLEGLVFGARAARAMPGAPQAGRLAGPRREWTDRPANDTAEPGAPQATPQTESDVRHLMWEAAGLVARSRGAAGRCRRDWRRPKPRVADCPADRRSPTSGGWPVSSRWDT